MNRSTAQDLWGKLYKTGNRVPVTGDYADQRGVIVTFYKYTTFSPLCGNRSGGGCAYYRLVTIR